MRRLLLAFCLLWPGLSGPGPSQAAECNGRDLIAALPTEARAALKARAEVPFAHGNLWTATREGEQITLVGTYHLNDPRFDPVLAELSPLLDKATALLVEAGPEEETALKAKIAAEPGLILLPPGPTLPEQMAEADWQRLSDALKARGMAPFMAARMQPWLVASMLEMPACMFPLAQGTDQGLDKRLMAEAKSRGLPIHALEPFDTVLKIFATFSPKDQLAMLNQTVATDADSADMAATLAAAYFAGESRLFWEFSRQEMAALPGMTPEEIDREMGLVETAMITSRNAAWIPVLEQAAKKGPVLAAFGALHLAGESGVLNLLAKQGWTVTALTP